MLRDDPFFWQALRNTGWMVLVAVPVQLTAALLAALVLARPRRGIVAYRTSWYLPSVVPPVAATLAFAFLLDPSHGPVNRALGGLGLPEPLWFADPAAAKPGLLLVGLWGVGNTVLVLLAGLGRVPQDLHELAVVEGAGWWRSFRHVTFPHLSPVLLFTLLVAVIGACSGFTQGYVAAQVTSRGGGHLGSPQGSTLFLPTWLYNQAFRNFDAGYAAALGWALLLGTLGLIAVIVRWSRRWVHLPMEAR
jgi:multiple sugar transport system permease protein